MEAFRAIPIQERIEMASKIRLKYPTRVPLICDGEDPPAQRAKKRIKYLVPRDMTLGTFQQVIRRKGAVATTQAIYFFCNNGKLLSSSVTLGHLSETMSGDDGFVYIRYRPESTFGL